MEMPSTEKPPSFSCKWFDSLAPCPWNCSGTTVSLHLYSLFFFPHCVVPHPLCEQRCPQTPQHRDPLLSVGALPTSGLFSSCPLHVRSLGLESNTRSSPVCVRDGCIHVKAAPANLWQATGLWDFGNRHSLVLMWVSKMMDFSPWNQYQEERGWEGGKAEEHPSHVQRGTTCVASLDEQNPCSDQWFAAQILGGQEKTQ